MFNLDTMRRINAIYAPNSSNPKHLIRYEVKNPVLLAGLIKIIITHDTHFCKKKGLELVTLDPVTKTIIYEDPGDNHIQLTALGSDYLKELLQEHK
jgi:hypothetical protein